MPAPTIAFEKFRDDMLAAGCEEVLEREWEPLALVPTHTHPFEVNVLVVQGELWLTEQGGTARRLEAGDRFQLRAKSRPLPAFARGAADRTAARVRFAGLRPPLARLDQSTRHSSNASALGRRLSGR